MFIRSLGRLCGPTQGSDGCRCPREPLGSKKGPLAECMSSRQMPAVGQLALSRRRGECTRSLSLSLALSLCLSLSLSLYVCLNNYHSMYVYIYLFIYLFIYLNYRNIDKALHTYIYIYMGNGISPLTFRDISKLQVLDGFLV